MKTRNRFRSATLIPLLSLSIGLPGCIGQADPGGPGGAVGRGLPGEPASSGGMGATGTMSDSGGSGVSNETPASGAMSRSPGTEIPGETLPTRSHAETGAIDASRSGVAPK